ncbi:cytochrome P450 [Actinoalloteichus hoggarensis]|uniref:Pentalenene oxygenase n=1 Tax=Actinoalloteichus hoggarensis TaxID=1470176 RepID=A0A221W344_9PSEU|nr:cytochrome P450 [Actinoalloteichus hoggarensis]ASO20041.1 Pentalenene oxygenase [Actinoalloteichus hoggarensis]MBB5919248.1 cytochrome P450 [Actinoalloteichus hoggarensis]
MGESRTLAVRRPASHDGLPPGPNSPALLQTVMLAGRLQPYLDSCRRRYGDCFTLRTLSWGPCVFVSSPELVKAVFAADPNVLRAGEHSADMGLGEVLGPTSLVVQDGEEHRRRRHSVSAAFQGKAVRHSADEIAEIARAEVARWPRDTPVALLEPMQSIALEVILRIVIGVTDETRTRRLRALLPRVASFDRGPMMWSGLRKTPSWQRYLRIQAEARELLTQEIADRRTRTDLAERTDTLSMVLSGGGDLAENDVELVDLLISLLLAGHETSSTGMAWALERLVQHPEAMHRIQAAADLGDPSLEAQLDSLVREALRIRTITPITARKAAAPVRLGPWNLPAGVNVMISAGLVHMSPDNYAAPEEFRPDRFLNDKPDPYAWVPFGGGARRCVGAALALLEMKEVLRTVLAEVDLHRVDDRSERSRLRHVTFMPDRGTRVVVRQR